jgi:hypothetical protein
MDERLYIRQVDENPNIKLHPDDEASSNWTGDTAAEEFKPYQERARAAARLSVLSSTQQRIPTKTGPSLQKSQIESFEFGSKHRIEHPTNKQLMAAREYQVLPDATNWGLTFTHVVIDKIATTLPAVHSVNNFNCAFITNIERKQRSNTTRMTCTVIVPSNDTDDDHTSNNNNNKKYRLIQSYDSDVLPLKEEDIQHMNLSIRLNKLTNIAY